MSIVSQPGTDVFGSRYNSSGRESGNGDSRAAKSQISRHRRWTGIGHSGAAQDCNISRGAERNYFRSSGSGAKERKNG